MNTHKVKSMRRQVILGALLLLAPAVAAAPFMMNSWTRTATELPAVAQNSNAEEAGAPDAASVLKVATSSEPPAADCYYPMIPGGVSSREDVRAAIERDAVVAAHFTFVHIESLREQRSEGRMVFVSYRIGDEVHWSRERVALEPGELVLTDGSHEIRARCGNLVSENPPLETRQPWPVYLSVLGIGNEYADSPSTGTAASGDLIDPVSLSANPAPGGNMPGPRNPSGVLIPVQPGSSNSGSGDGDGGGTTGGSGGGGGGIGGGGSGGGSGSGQGGGNTNDGSSGGGSGSGGDTRTGGSEGSGDEGGNPGGGNPGSDSGPGGTRLSGGDSPSSPNGNPEEPGTGNTGGSDPGGTEPSKPSRIVDPQADGSKEEVVVSVPEPTSLSLLMLGFGAAAFANRRNRKR